MTSEGRTRWGKAGVRLTEREAVAIDARNARRHVEAKLAAERDEREGRDAWVRGLLRPWAITLALNARGLYGPEVDEDCGTMEPAVDMWEDGQLYPTWPEFKALAKLTGYPLGHFWINRDPMPVEATTLRFHLSPEVLAAPGPVPCFLPEAIQAATGTPRCPYCHLSARPVLPVCLFCPCCGSAQADGDGVRTVAGPVFAQCPDCGGRWPAEAAADRGGAC